jgi:hypothetical protein
MSESNQRRPFKLWNSRHREAALIAMAQETTGEIERLRSGATRGHNSA